MSPILSTTKASRILQEQRYVLYMYIHLAHGHVPRWWFVFIFLFPGICFEVYSPLGNPNRPKKGDDDPSVLDDPVINEIAKKHNATPAQVWNTNCNDVLYRGRAIIYYYVMHHFEKVSIAFCLSTNARLLL